MAMSTRNGYLSSGERQTALCLYKGLRAGEQLIRGGEKSVERILARVTQELRRGTDLRVDYLELRDALTLEGFAAGGELRKGVQVVLAVAAQVGRARLIDNLLVTP